MQCKKCGTYIDETKEKFCYYCGEKIDNIKVPIVNNIDIDQKSQKFLIMGIMLAFCCSMPFGIAVVLLNELKYKPQLRENNLEEANKTKKIMIALFVVGLILGVLVSGLSFFVEFITDFE